MFDDIELEDEQHQNNFTEEYDKETGEVFTKPEESASQDKTASKDKIKREEFY